MPSHPESIHLGSAATPIGGLAVRASSTVRAFVELMHAEVDPSADEIARAHADPRKSHGNEGSVPPALPARAETSPGVPPPAPALTSERSKDALVALVGAVLYALASTTYIVVSSTLAARLSADLVELERFETWKGIAFVVVTAFLIFTLLYVAARRRRLAKETLERCERALVEAERRSFAGLIASTIAHDSNNALLVIQTEIERLSEAMPDSADHGLATMQLCVDRLTAMNRRLVEASTGKLAANVAPVDVRRTVHDCFKALRSHGAVRGCKVSFFSDDELQVETDHVLLFQIVSNLLVNAAQACEGRGKIELHVRRRGSEALVEVHDDGPGVPAARRAQLFDALASTRRGGAGLGLFGVRACVEALGGQIEVEDSPLGGALFRLRLALKPD